MKVFFLAVAAISAVAAYAGDVANPRCDWTLDGYACTAVTVADAASPVSRRL